ncbi:MAG: superoxide reductase [Desulfovibrionales bacterium]|jgi:superoxide reductase|nr:superoxide reductase [Desulfovibrionales bacterium]
MQVGELFQSADWKSEKHVPVIECPDSVAADELFEVKVSLGKEIAHPNTTEHHIRWIRLYFKPEGEKFAVEVGSFEFCAHAEAAAGPNEGSVTTHHAVTCAMKTKKAGTLVASAYCNIHGLWESSKEIKVS